MKPALVWAVGLALSAAAGWFAMLAWIPGHASDMLWSQMLARGSQLNVLSPPTLRKAPQDIIPMANADMTVRSAIYDLSGGPIMFEADVPEGLPYWSVSVFQRNTDAIFVANDRTLGPGPFKLVIRRADQKNPLKGVAEAVSPSTRGYLMVRPMLADRNDASEVSRAMAAVVDEKVTVLR